MEDIPDEQQIRADRHKRAEFLRVFLFLDAAMWLAPNLTLRILMWADPDLAAYMASKYA